MPATIRIAAPILVSLWAGSSFAQSTVTLESFDLDETPREAFEAPNTRPAGNCLLNPDADGCGTIDRSTRTFSLNDVVNLGIIERDEVERKDVNGRVVTVEERGEPLPSIDLEILFDYNSANLRPDQMAPLIALSRDLAEIDFTRAQLVLMGHTDGVGSAAYNRELSHRRAQSVAAFLAQAADIPIYRIKASGMGFDYLKYPSDPRNAANRRVQVLLVE